MSDKAPQRAKRQTVYPSSQTWSELGDRAPDLNRALDRYAILRRLMASPDSLQDAIFGVLAHMLYPHELGVCNVVSGQDI